MLLSEHVNHGSPDHSQSLGRQDPEGDVEHVFYRVMDILHRQGARTGSLTHSHRVIQENVDEIYPLAGSILPAAERHD